MSTPIYYDGVAYPNLEAMSAAVRALYEAEAEDDDEPEEDQDESGSADADEDQPGAMQPPAWGGARAGGSVAVPREFEPVTGLGPALQVSSQHGLRLMPHFGPPRLTQLVRYRDGLAYQTGSKDVHTLAWEDVVDITTNNTYHPEQHNSWTDHEYTLTRKGGDKLILDDGLKAVEAEILAIKQAVYALLRPPALQRYKAGEALTFGALTAQKHGGLQLDGQGYAWAAIKDVQIVKGHLRVTLATGQKHDARVSAIPNIELLCQFIGVTLNQTQLAYEAFL